MDRLTCGLINGPFVIFNMVSNVFFIFCMVRPLHRERIKQPLKLLLWSLICCTLTFLVSAVVLLSSDLTHDNFNGKFQVVLFVVLYTSMALTMYSSVWLNFFYYTQIVPAQRALFIWIKKNIKRIIYCIWFMDKIFCAFDVGVLLLTNFALNNLISGGFTYNFTMYNSTVYLLIPSAEWQENVNAVAVFIAKAHFALCLCVMVMSIGSTVVYLCRHMRRMVANGQSFTCPRFSSQVRVTGTGILQGVLYAICAVWILHTSLSASFSTFTVLNFYMAGTTFSLGAGQAVFRQRAADVWLRAAQWCRASEVQQSDEGR